ncbi:ATP-binding cassette domain-containing protein, partial [Salmonella enterica subsp. enterica serovar Sandiego]|nr:ATP-binding cassette domain-containing protein [Salmonella enterica subsp. enterica serovar Sandiego]
MKTVIPKVLYQEETNECGLACLAMLAETQGVITTLDELRNIFPRSKNGSSLYDLIEISKKLGLDCVPVQYSIEELSEIPLPAILHYGEGHYVLLVYRKGKHVCVLNPAVGNQLLTYNALKKNISGYALILSNPVTVNQLQCNPKNEVLKTLSLKQTSTIPGIYKLLTLTFVMSLTAFIMPSMINNMMNAFVTKGIEDKTQYIYYFLAFVLSSLLAIFVRVYSEKLIKTESLKKSATGFLKLMSHPVQFYERRTPGDIYSRYISWVNSLSLKISTDNILRCDWFISLIAFLLMYWISPLLSLLSFAMVIIMGGISIFSLYKDRHYTQQLQIKSANLNDFLMETLQGIKTIKSCRIENRRSLMFGHVSNEFYSCYQKRNIWEEIKGGMYQLVTTIDFLIFMLLSLPLVSSGVITLGEFFSYTFIKQIYSSSVTKIFYAIVEKFKFRIIDDRVSNLICVNDDIRLSPAGALKPNAFDSCNITLENISYSYENEKEVISNFSYEFKTGSQTVITGTSGVGKSTLLKIASGILEAKSGTILLNGKIVNSDFLMLNSFLHSQDDIIFKSTMLDNISLFDQILELEKISEIEKLLHILKINDCVERMPSGLNSLISDNNVSLSLGQRQRLLIARALFSKKPILLLDEPTANLDDDTAEDIMKEIMQYCAEHKMTLLVVSHSEKVISLFENKICM